MLYPFKTEHLRQCNKTQGEAATVNICFPLPSVPINCQLSHLL